MQVNKGFRKFVIEKKEDALFYLKDRKIIEWFNLTEREKIIIYGIWYDEKSYRDIGDELKLSAERIRQIYCKVRIKIAYQIFHFEIRFNKLNEIEEKNNSLNQQVNILKNLLIENGIIHESILAPKDDEKKKTDPLNIAIEDMDIPVRIKNAFRNSEIKKLSDLATWNIEDFLKIRNLGYHSLSLFLLELKFLGISIPGWNKSPLFRRLSIPDSYYISNYGGE